MNEVKKKISQLKFHTFEEATSVAIPITNTNHNETIAYLIPCGEWIIEDARTLLEIAKWRNKFMRFYLTQFKANLENATSYMMSKTSLSSSSIFFMIADTKFRVIGHIGMSNIVGNSAELDNVLQGETSQIPNLMIAVERQFLEWATNHFGLKQVFLKVLSYNFLAINLHEQCGFKVSETISLRKVQYKKMFKYEPCQNTQSNLEFSCLVMEKNWEKG
jgi:RimJ/RimL family protein N-acetyltransferase